MKVVVIKERSAGNETVGDMWLDTEIFEAEANLRQILAWAKGKGTGRLMISVPDSEKPTIF